MACSPMLLVTRLVTRKENVIEPWPTGRENFLPIVTRNHDIIVPEQYVPYEGVGFRIDGYLGACKSTLEHYNALRSCKIH